MRLDEVALPEASFGHLLALTDRHGIHEHAEYGVPRPEHGYCTDDVARAITVAVCEPGITPAREALTETYLGFLEQAIVPDGSAHNRMSPSGAWIDDATTDDCWGRALGGLGSVVRLGRSDQARSRALRAFHRGAQRRSVDVRASSFAALGAVDVLRAHPGDEDARRLLADCLDRIPSQPTGTWEWCERRLRYANATLCAALIAGGDELGRPVVVRDGLSLLAALLRIESGPLGRLSLTGSTGRGPGEPGPLWDQQPIEAAAIAEACAIAYETTFDPFWAAGVQLAWNWFAGDNDARFPLYDPWSGAGYDGLTPMGRNENRGAESTLAAMRTLQHARAMSRTLAWAS